jgi:uncharacterized protein with HEPN domain
MRRDSLGALEHILFAVQNITAYTTGMTFEQFESDLRTRQAVERNFEIIGEAVNRLRSHDPSVAAQISSHNQIVAFRNALIHGYDRIDYQKVWQTAQESLPVLRAEVEQLLREMDERLG